MRGQYLTRCGLRPRPGTDAPEGAHAPPARVFLCPRCRAQLLTCSPAAAPQRAPNLTTPAPSMPVPPESPCNLQRYFHVEKGPRTTSARPLTIKRGTVKRVLARAGLPPISLRPRPSRIDPYLPFIHQTLEKFPMLAASRLYVMVHERGYRGRPHHFRHLIACLRPRPKAESFLRLRSLPGQQAQVDWAHFGHLVIGRARRPLMAFVMA